MRSDYHAEADSARRRATHYRAMSERVVSPDIKAGYLDLAQAQDIAAKEADALAVQVERLRAEREAKRLAEVAHVEELMGYFEGKTP